jgi:hypothetical protein
MAPTESRSEKSHLLRLPFVRHWLIWARSALAVSIWLTVISVATANSCTEDCPANSDGYGWSVETDIAIPDECDSRFVERCDWPEDQPEDSEPGDTDDEDSDD